MNNYKYTPSSAAFDERLKESMVKIEREFKNGNIKTETDYAYQVKKTIAEFYESLGKPSFVFHEASTIPSFEHYVDMVSRTVSDFSVLISGANAVSEEISSARSEMNDNITMLLKRTDGILSSTNSLKKRVESLRVASNSVYSDDFMKEENVHLGTKKEETAFSDTASGVLILPVLKNASLSSVADLEVLSTSNGFPGNTHEVHYSVGNINGNIKYKGETNPRINLDSVKVSDVASYSNTDWFEFEMFNIDEEVKNDTSMIGFMYKEGISWITDEKKLKLNLKVTLRKPSILNHFSITAIPRTNSNVGNPVVTRIIVSDEEAGVQTITVNQPIDGKLLVPFNAQVAKTVSIEIEQQDSYLTNVCRQYGLNIDPRSVSKFVDMDFKGFIQTERPVHSINLLNLKYDKKDKSIIYPNTKDRFNFVDKEFAKAELFFASKSSENYHVQYDIVEANRYSIGISEIDIRYREYTERGVYVSKTFKSEEPIKTITFNSDDYIPDGFRNHLKEGESFEDFLKYSISLDEGNTWIPIHPRHRAHINSCSIVVNSNSAVVNRNKNITYVDMLYDPTTFKVKIELSRPEAVIDETPMVDRYFLEVGTEEDL